MNSYWDNFKAVLSGCRSQLITAATLSVFSGLIDLICLAALPAFVYLALRGGEVSGMGGMIGRFAPDDFRMVAAGVFGLFLIRAGMTLLIGSRLSRLTESIREKIVIRIVSRRTRQPYANAIDESMADGITATTAHSYTFSTVVVLPSLRMIVDLLTILFVLSFLLVYDWVFVVVVSGALLITGTFYTLVIRRSSDKHSRRMVTYKTDLTQQISQVLSAPREVRIYNLQQHFIDKLRVTLEGMSHSQSWLGAIYWFPRALGELMLISLAIFYMLSRSQGGMAGADVLSNLSMLAFAGLRLLPAFSQTMTNLAFIRSGRNVTSILAAETRSNVESSCEHSIGAPQQPVFRSLELRDVVFRYPGATNPTLDGISLRIERGQSIGIIGKSGAGKSTLGDLLLGLLQPEQGTAHANDGEIDLLEAAWRECVGFVQQNPYIANDSLMRNIAYGLADKDIDSDLIRKAVDRAGLSEVVAKLPDGLETVVGDNGVKLSGGQRQRVAIARALYREREVLILDEATSALDSQTEQEIVNALADLRGSITTVVIAHRLSTLADCDIVLELTEGRIAKTYQHGEIGQRSERE